MPEQRKPRFERTELPPDVMRLLDVSADFTETDLRFERLAQLDEKMDALLRHFEKLAAIAERMQR